MKNNYPTVSKEKFNHEITEYKLRARGGKRSS